MNANIKTNADGIAMPLSNDKKKELLTERREYQRNRRARLKAEVKATKLVESSHLLINQKINI